MRGLSWGAPQVGGLAQFTSRCRPKKGPRGLVECDQHLTSAIQASESRAWGL